VQVHLHIADYLFGSGKAKRSGVADVEFEHFGTVGNHSVCLVEDGASYFVTDIVQFR